MKLWPRSLRARLTLLLFGVLLVAQLFSMALHYRDRGEILKEASGYNLVQRITGMVVVLDQLSPEKRESFVLGMDAPPLHVNLLDQPQKLPDQRQDSTRAALLHRLLHIRLGEDRRVMVLLPPVERSRSSREPAWPDVFPERMRRMMASHMGRGMGMGMMGPISRLVVQVELQGGQWALFTYRFPGELMVWPLGLLLGLGVLLLAVWLVSFIALRWLTRPLSTLAYAAEELGKDINHAPLSEQGPVEVSRAARAFNRMQQRLVRFLEERTRLLTAISHDLKTPVTRMRLRIERIEDSKLRESLEQDLVDMQTMIQSSLDFMHGISLREETRPLDIGALVGSLAEDAHEAGHSVQVTGAANKPYVGRPLALKRAIGNLLDNAVRYAGTVKIEIQDNADELRIIFRDNGPGIPDELLEKVFEPFFRVEGSRNPKTGGTGLGLSITRNIARAQGGDVVLRNRTEGGLEATLVLPR